MSECEGAVAGRLMKSGAAGSGVVRTFWIRRRCGIYDRHQLVIGRGRRNNDATRRPMGRDRLTNDSKPLMIANQRRRITRNDPASLS